MSSIRSGNGLLFFDFRYSGKRCREYSKLPDNAANRKKMQKALDKIEAEITLGTFEYAKYFPGSKNAEKFSTISPRASHVATPSKTPLFNEFAETWFNENTILWRRSHIDTIRSTLDRHLIPEFGEMPVGSITKADVLSFRSDLGKIKGRNGNRCLAAKTINRIIQVLRQILDEAGERYDFNNPADKVKRLKQRRVDIQPFDMDEVRLIIESVRADYRQYMIVRFFTGLRTGELHGLQWKYVDFERRQILVRETLVKNRVEYTKTDGSQREVDMSQPVYDALKAQHEASGDLSRFVFCNRKGEPIDLDNFTNRVWYPLLRYLHLEKRRPYQTRHTAATLWMAAGENPEWVARQLGHVDTMMLFKTYSRFVPNLTRQDGTAFDGLLSREGFANTRSDTAVQRTSH